MNIPRARVVVALILGSGLFLSACSSAPTSETTSAPAGSTEPAESSANLGTCEKVLALAITVGLMAFALPVALGW